MIVPRPPRPTPAGQPVPPGEHGGGAVLGGGQRAVLGAELEPDARLPGIRVAQRVRAAAPARWSRSRSPAARSPGSAGPGASASVSAAAGVDTLTWGTVALPPPWVTGLTAFGPDHRQAADRGRVQRQHRRPPGSGSLRSSVNAAAAHRRSSAGSARTGAATVIGAAAGRQCRRFSAPDPAGQPQDAQHLGVDRVLADLRRPAPPRLAGRPTARPGPAWPGRARPAAVATVLRAACQSDRATPPKPHSSLRTRRQQQACSVIGDAVDPVVAGHHQVHVRLAHAGLERDQVQLAQHVLGDPRVVGPAPGLGVVAHVVLDRGGDPGLTAARGRRPRRSGRSAPGPRRTTRSRARRAACA